MKLMAELVISVVIFGIFAVAIAILCIAEEEEW